MATATRPRKQSIQHEDFLRILADTPTLVPRASFDALMERTLAHIKLETADRNVAYAWSGGKDSIALEIVMDAAGITECCFGMTNLEYQAFLVWVTDHMPFGLEVFNNGWDLDWLKRHPAMLFPSNSTDAAKWFAGNQQDAQKRYAKRRGIDLLITGKRRDDGNLIFGNTLTYSSGGINRYAPLWEWTHADVFAACIYTDRIHDMPPFYSWPRGYRVGTHSWPARQWCANHDQGWRETFIAEPARVIEAANFGIDGAAEWLDKCAEFSD